MTAASPDLGDQEHDQPCPVPQAQRPLEEYRQLCQSWFFAWPSASSSALARPLIISWLLLWPLAALIAGGSVSLRHATPALLPLVAALAALTLPLLLLLRQWLGWTYVARRLRAERVPYEESGWYDGQIWEKPLSWRQQDLLVLRHQVDPVIRRLQQAFGVLAALLLLGSGLCQAL
ncbi:MAG: CGLD27 family protein [Cyanobacteriota bacterium]